MKLASAAKKATSSACYLLQKRALFGLELKNGFRALLYHSVGGIQAGDRLGISVTRENFYEQMMFLRREGYSVYSIETLVALTEEKKPIPSKSIAITFDDGYKDVLQNAAPILQKFNFPATIFIVQDYIDGLRSCGGNFWEKWECLSWDDLQHLISLNITIGSHSVSHKAMSDLSKEAMRDEVAGSKLKLEERLGVPVKFFSYPHGSVNSESKCALKDAGYVAAFSSLVGKNHYNIDAFELRRTEISSNDDIFEFEKKVCGCYDWISRFKK